MGAFTKQRNSDYDGENPNVNVTWISNPLFWAFYVSVILAVRWALYFVPEDILPPQYSWTVVSVAHGIVRCRLAGGFWL